MTVEQYIDLHRSDMPQSVREELEATLEDEGVDLDNPNLERLDEIMADYGFPVDDDGINPDDDFSTILDEEPSEDDF